MISVEAIETMLDEEAVYSGYERVIREERFLPIAKRIHDIISVSIESEIKNAALEAKIKAYESIIENSNFKMAVVKGRSK